VEAEVDQVRARDPPSADQPHALARRRAGHEVEPHAREALLEVEHVHRLDPAEDILAARVDRLVSEQRHFLKGKIKPCGR